MLSSSDARACCTDGALVDRFAPPFRTTPVNRPQVTACLRPGRLFVLDMHRAGPALPFALLLHLAMATQMESELLGLLFRREGEDGVAPERRPPSEAVRAGNALQPLAEPGLLHHIVPTVTACRNLGWGFAGRRVMRPKPTRSCSAAPLLHRVDDTAPHRAAAGFLEHIPFGWNQPNGMCPVKQHRPRALAPSRRTAESEIFDSSPKRELA
jgi:hypothetical protein